MSYRCFGFRTSGDTKGMFSELVFEDLGTGWIYDLFGCLCYRTLLASVPRGYYLNGEKGSEIGVP